MNKIRCVNANLERSGYFSLSLKSGKEGHDVLSVIVPVNPTATVYIGLKSLIKHTTLQKNNAYTDTLMRSATHNHEITVKVLTTASGVDAVSGLKSLIDYVLTAYIDYQATDLVIRFDSTVYERLCSGYLSKLQKMICDLDERSTPPILQSLKDEVLVSGELILREKILNLFQNSAEVVSDRFICEQIVEYIGLFQSFLKKLLVEEEMNRIFRDYATFLCSNRSFYASTRS